MNDGGPAFPWQYWDRTFEGTPHVREQGLGMSLRDWFAGLAMQGIQASCTEGYPNPGYVAEQAYKSADAMLNQREINRLAHELKEIPQKLPPPL